MRTFDEGCAASEADVFLAILSGANHFSLAHEHDGTTGREFLDWDVDGDPAAIRACIAALVLEFVRYVTARDVAARADLLAMLDRPDLSLSKQR